MKTIAIFTGYFLPHVGGVERYVDKISKELAACGYRVVIVTSNNDNYNSYEQLDNKRSIYRIPIHGLFKNRYPIPKTNSEYRSLLKKLSEEDIDFFILNTRFHLTSLIGARLAKAMNKEAILIEHGTSHFTVGNKILDSMGLIYEHALTHVIKGYVRRFFGVSKKCNDWLRHYRIKAEGVIYNSIEPEDLLIANDEFIKQYKSDSIIITYAGRLIKEKGILNLLDAFTDMNNPKARLVIAGDGPLLDQIKVFSRKHENIDVLGRLNFARVMSLYKRSDIFVYPSLYPEGLPTSILEAGLMSCAVIATPRGGTEEVIIDSEHGRIINGSVSSIKEALSDLVNNPKSRKSVSETIRRRISTQFTWKNTTQNLISIIEGHDE